MQLTHNRDVRRRYATPQVRQTKALLVPSGKNALRFKEEHGMCSGPGSGDPILRSARNRALVRLYNVRRGAAGVAAT